MVHCSRSPGTMASPAASAATVSEIDEGDVTEHQR